MSFASSNLGRAILVLIVIVVSILIFSSKLRGAVLPLLGWNTNPGGSSDGYVYSSTEMAVEKLDTFLDTISGIDNRLRVNFDLGTHEFYVYFGRYNGNNYYLLFRDEDPDFKIGESYSVSLKEGKTIVIEKGGWFDSKKEYTPNYFKTLDLRVYDFEKFRGQVPYRSSEDNNKLWIFAKLKDKGDKKDYYFYPYKKDPDRGCKVRSSNTIFVSDKNDFGGLSNLQNCVNVNNLFDELYKNLNKINGLAGDDKIQLQLNEFDKLDDRHIFILGLYNDGSGMRNLLLGYNTGTTHNRVKIFSSDYEKIVFTYDNFDQYNDLRFTMINYPKEISSSKLIVPTKDPDEDYVNKLRDYVSPGEENQAVFVPMLIIYNSGYAIISRPYEDMRFSFDYDVNGLDSKINIICNENYCSLEP